MQASSVCEIQEQTKVCSKCCSIKRLDDFSRSARGLLGRRADCKECHAEHKRLKRLENIDDAREKGREKYASNPEKAREYTAKWRAANLEKAVAYDRAYKEKNREIIRARDRARIAADPSKHAEKSRIYRQNNPDKALASTRNWIAKNPHKPMEYMRKKLQTVQGKLQNTIRAGVHRGITSGSKGGRRTFTLLGYSKDELIVHLESLFLPGMSWKNYGEWHIDHKIPLAAHTYDTPDCPDFKRAWALSNLQPLWATDNRKKQAKLIYTR